MVTREAPIDIADVPDVGDPEDSDYVVVGRPGVAGARRQTRGALLAPAVALGESSRDAAQAAVTQAQVAAASAAEARAAAQEAAATAEDKSGAAGDLVNIEPGDTPLSASAIRRDGTRQPLQIAPPAAQVDLSGDVVTVDVGGETDSVSLSNSTLATRVTATETDLSGRPTASQVTTAMTTATTAQTAAANAQAAADSVAGGSIAVVDDDGTPRLAMQLNDEGRIVFTRADGSTITSLGIIGLPLAKPDEADLGFWRFGADNVALEEFGGGRALTPNTNAAPDSTNVGYVTLAAATSNGLLSDVIDRDQVTWWGMVRFPGTTAQVIVGAFNRDLTPRSFGTFSNGADINVEGGPVSSRSEIAATPQDGSWVFVGGSVDAAGNYLAYVSDGTTPTSINGTGARNVSAQPIAVGDGADRGFTNGLEVAELGIGSAFTDAATFDEIATDAFARLAERVTV